MTRAEIVAFLNEAYKADETIIWQTLSKSDLEGMLNTTITDEKWEEFADENQDYLSNQMSQSARDEAYDLIVEEEED